MNHKTLDDWLDLKSRTVSLLTKPFAKGETKKILRLQERLVFIEEQIQNKIT